MQVTHRLQSDTLLTYSLATAPTPVCVSPQSGPPSVAALSFAISCPASVDSVTVKQIAFNLPVGDPAAPVATDLTVDATSITASVSSSGSDTWNLARGTAPGVFVLTPATGGGVVTTQGIVVTLTGIHVAPVVGTAAVKIVELTVGSSFPLVTTIAVPKFPYGFFAGEFNAAAPQIPHGGSAKLTWMGSVGPKYTLLWGTNSQDVSPLNAWTSPALTNTTTFILQVVAQQASETVTIQFSVTVIVADPDFTATTLNVLQTTSLVGRATVGSAAAPADLTVSGTVNAATVAVTGTSSSAGLSVSGSAHTNILSAKDLSADKATLKNVSIDGLEAKTGAVSLLAGCVELTPSAPDSPTVIQTQTDGFVFGYVGSPPGNPTAGCVCTLGVEANGVTAQCTGGNLGFFANGQGHMTANPNSFILPVTAGSAVKLWFVQNTDGQQIAAPYKLYWMPLGSPPGSHARSTAR
jgi:hypothetical protein